MMQQFLLSVILNMLLDLLLTQRLIILGTLSKFNLTIKELNFSWPVWNRGIRAHRHYDAAILTKCYTQHALGPFIDSEINHIRHFIKV